MGLWHKVSNKIGRNIVYVLNINSLNAKEYAAAAGLSCVIFLWPIQIWIQNVGIPLYIIISPLLILLSKFTNKNIILFVGILFLLFVLSILQKAQGVVFTTPMRSFTAIVIFCFVFTCASRWLHIVLTNKQKIFFLFCKYFLITQVLIQLLQLTLWKIGLFNTNYKHLFEIPRCYGYFLEPSLVASGLSPFVYLFVFHRKLFFYWLGKSGIICLFLIFILCPSTTLVGVLAIAAFFLQIRSCTSVRALAFTLISSIFLIATFVWIISHIPATMDRIVDLCSAFSDPESISGAQNFSSLLLLKGFQMASASLEHYILGVGFLNFQFLNDYSAVSLLNDFLYESNAFEGTSSGFKLVGEFGYLGLIVLIIMLFIFLKNIKKTNHNIILENFMLFGLMASCIRGASYFDGFQLLALVVIINKSFNNIKLKIKQSVFGCAAAPCRNS